MLSPSHHQERRDSDPLSDAEPELQGGRGGPQDHERCGPGRPGRSKKVCFTQTTQAPYLDVVLFTLARYPPTRLDSDVWSFLENNNVEPLWNKARVAVELMCVVS